MKSVSEMMRLDGKHAVVTGGLGWLGHAMTEALTELSKLLRVVLSRGHQEEVPSDETTDTTVSVRKRPPAVGRAGDIRAEDPASADAAATAGSSSARRGEQGRKGGERR